MKNAVQIKINNKSIAFQNLQVRNGKRCGNKLNGRRCPGTLIVTVGTKFSADSDVATLQSDAKLESKVESIRICLLHRV